MRILVKKVLYNNKVVKNILVIKSYHKLFELYDRLNSDSTIKDYLLQLL